MGEETQYTLSLRDLFTGKIKNADHAVNAMEGSLHSAGRAASSLAGTLLGVFSVTAAGFMGVELIKSAAEDYHKLEQANAQLKAGLESTGHAAGVTFEELETSSKKFAAQFKVTRGEVSDMQSLLLTFPGITKTIFDESTQAIIDMSTRLHKGLNETSIMVGKALQDPTKGITALRRVGVNFNEEQTKIIKNLVATGHIAQAQAKILHELQTEFAGSAKAAADAEPLFRYHKIMEDIRLSIGKVAIELIEKLAPALEWAAKKFQSVVEYIIAMPPWLKELAGVLTIAAVSAIVFSVASGILTTVLGGLSGAILLAAGALDILAANPIVFALGLIVYALAKCFDSFSEFKAFLIGVWAVIKEFAHIVTDVFMGLGKVIAGVLTFSPSLVIEGAKQTIDAVSNAGSRMGEAFHTAFDQEILWSDKMVMAAPKDIVKPGKNSKGKPGEDGKTETAKATGQKNITINIKMDALIKQFQITTTNMIESAAKVKEMVAQSIISAVNDSQIVAGQ